MGLIKRYQVVNNSNSKTVYSYGSTKLKIPGNSTNVFDVPYELSAQIKTGLEALGAIKVTDLGVFIDDEESSSNVNITGNPAITGTGKVVTDGSNATVTTTGNGFAHVLIGAAITANNATRYVIAKSDDNTITLDAPVDWDNSDAGYSWTFKNPLLFCDDAGALRGFLRADGALHLVLAGGTVQIAAYSHIDHVSEDHTIEDLEDIGPALDDLAATTNAIIGRLEEIGFSRAS